MQTHSAQADERVHAQILLAEDDTDMRALITDALRSDGYHVRGVGNGLELWSFLDHATNEMVDLVVSDIMMPGCTGIDVLSALRRRDWSTPVVLITAFGDDETRAEARRLGAATLLDKPFTMDQLRHAVRSIVPPTIGLSPLGQESP